MQQHLELPFRPATIESVRVRAVYLEGQLDLKRFRAGHPEYPVLASDPLLIEPERGCFVALLKFGGLVFWNCSDATERALRSEAGALMASSSAARTDDQIELLIGTTENLVTFNEVRVKELTVDRMQIVSLALAQSVALDSLEQEVAAALARFGPVVGALREGRLTPPVKEVVKAVGFALQVRSTVLANLTLFDKPPETWESEMLERLDNQLYDFFDLEERLSAINQKVAYFTDMSTMLLTLLSRRQNVQLELAIIVLILIEVLLFVWTMLGTGAAH